MLNTYVHEYKEMLSLNNAFCSKNDTDPLSLTVDFKELQSLKQDIQAKGGLDVSEHIKTLKDQALQSRQNKICSKVDSGIKDSMFTRLLLSFNKHTDPRSMQEKKQEAKDMKQLIQKCGNGNGK